MKLDATILLAGLFLLPSVVFVIAFRQHARIERSQGGDSLVLLAALIGLSVAIHFLTVLVFGAVLAGFPGADAANSDWLDIESLGGIAGFFATRWKWAVLYVGLACICAAIVGAGLSLAIVWGWLRSSVFHGPLYDVVSGFLLPQIYVDAVSSTRLDDRPIIYSGLLHDIRISAAGRIEWVAIAAPSKRQLATNSAGRPAQEVAEIITGPARRIRSERPKDEVAPSLLEVLILEGENIENVFLASQPKPPERQPPWRRAAHQAFHMHRQAVSQPEAAWFWWLVCALELAVLVMIGISAIRT